MAQKLGQIDNSHLQAAMAYSINAGGKRVRPLLLLTVVSLFNGSVTTALPAAAGLEFVHTYSLIHDDLPAMDNDDLRRGQPTSHKQFGEAQAILAGDALLTDAFGIIATSDIAADLRIRLVALLAQAAGSHGMVSGQVRDLDGEHVVLDLAGLKRLHQQKTGALLLAAIQMGATLAQVSAADFEALSAFGQAFGLGFQIHDDILDVTASTAMLGKTANKDVAEAKNTFVSLLGLEGAQAALAEQVRLAQTALARLSVDATPLQQFLNYLK